MNISKLFPLLIVALTAYTAVSAQTYPAGTKVAIVPLICQTGEKWQELKDRQVKAGNDWLATEFVKRGFTVALADDVTKAIAELKIDLNDEEQRSRENLYKIGQRAGAQLVVFPVIVASSQTKTGGLFPKTQGNATIKLWLVDAVKRETIINAITVTGKASGSSFLTGFEKGSDLQVKAVGNALKDHLKNWFKPYPIIGGH